MRKPKLVEIKLSALKRDARNAEGAPDLDPAEYMRALDPIIIEGEGRSVDIVDGMHRAAGLLGWCEAAGQDPSKIAVLVVDVTGYDEATVGAAADGFGGEKQEKAIRKILRAVRGS